MAILFGKSHGNLVRHKGTPTPYLSPQVWGFWQCIPGSDNDEYGLGSLATIRLAVYSSPLFRQRGCLLAVGS